MCLRPIHGTGTATIRLTAATVLLSATVTPVTGCSVLGGSDCTPAELKVETVTVQDQRANLTLTAELASDSEPLADKRVHFAAVLEGGDAIQIGDGITDSDGVATMTQRGGIGERLLQGDTAVAYEASFDSWEDQKGKQQYCKAKETAKLSCDGGGCPHLDPAGPEL